MKTKVCSSPLQSLADADLDRVTGGNEESSTASTSSCVEDLGKLAAGSALTRAAKMPPATTALSSALVGFYGGVDIGRSCPPAVQRVFGVGPKKLFPQGSFR